MPLSDPPRPTKFSWDLWEESGLLLTATDLMHEIVAKNPPLANEDGHSGESTRKAGA